MGWKNSQGSASQGFASDRWNISEAAMSTLGVGAMLHYHCRTLGFAVAVVAFACVASLASGAEQTPRLTGFMLSSASFKDGGLMPMRHAAGPACGLNGPNVSPQLAWMNPPPGTKSYALIET